MDGKVEAIADEAERLSLQRVGARIHVHALLIAVVLTGLVGGAVWWL